MEEKEEEVVEEEEGEGVGKKGEEVEEELVEEEEDEKRGRSRIVSQNFSFLFLFGSSITPSDHLPIKFATYWRALFQTLMQNWQFVIRAKRLQVIGVILANQTEQT